MNDDLANYHAAGNNHLPSDDKDINTWGNLWATKKFQSCRCDGGWGGNDCSLRQCPRGDDPETQCADDLGNDIQEIECTNLLTDQDQFFKLRFTDLLSNRYNTRAVVIPTHPTLSQTNFAEVGGQWVLDAAHSIQTALESLPNFAIPKVEVTSTSAVPPYSSSSTKKKGVTTTTYDFAQPFTLKFEVQFTDARNSGQQQLLELVSDVKCDSGVQPKFENAATHDPTCTVTRKQVSDLRENAECSNRGLCNRKTAECNCFDGYTGLACDIIAQTY